MLKLTIPSAELFDEALGEFVYSKEQTIVLEHSLVSISKWESIFMIPFISKEERTWLETVEYVKCMTITQNVDPKVYNYLTSKNIKDIEEYIDHPMTATTVAKGKGGSREIVTAELIYYWMVSFNIPFECQKWHLNRLLMLVNVCSVKNQAPEKKSKAEIMNRNHSLNEARRAKYNTKG